ncbi:hypothetical protein K505DRAFT_57063 [Melanomma pulvis-pyrius CBS 109.77]|uniref:Uncharacterized protein n=1 Tax=Melanomma pulvis-pyrius CBS 109.77 TaxID=1314802 RepID=A0A6A6X7M3_9PLEO|nr:hypothetical protein K505DRAFT_57063 [Melanomma pulvis-pyrius CBS 109.77]
MFGCIDLHALSPPLRMARTARPHAAAPSVFDAHDARSDTFLRTNLTARARAAPDSRVWGGARRAANMFKQISEPWSNKVCVSQVAALRSQAVSSSPPVLELDAGASRRWEEGRSTSCRPGLVSRSKSSTCHGRGFGAGDDTMRRWGSRFAGGPGRHFLRLMRNLGRAGREESLRW